MKYRNKVKKKKGFTLVELLVVIAILGILMSLILPGLLKGKISAQKLECKAHLDSLYAMMMLYAQDNYDAYPNEKGKAFWETLRTVPTPEDSILAHEKKKHTIYICPLVGGKGGFGISHYRGPNYRVIGSTYLDTPIAADDSDNHQGEDIHILYFGGDVERVKPNDLGTWPQADEKLTGGLTTQ